MDLGDTFIILVRVLTIQTSPSTLVAHHLIILLKTSSVMRVKE